MTTIEAMESVKVGTRFFLKSGKVWEAIGYPYEPGIRNDGRFSVSARMLKNDKPFGPTHNVYDEKIIAIV